jgi:hypothetical protein
MHGGDEKCILNFDQFEGKRLLGRPRCIWEDNIQMDVKEIGLYSVHQSCLAQDRDQWRTDLCEHGGEPLGSMKAGNLLSKWLLASQEGLCFHIVRLKNSNRVVPCSLWHVTCL